jgi:pilus assembly protein FimV
VPQPLQADVPASPPATETVWQEVEIKLDLAKAYLEMTDRAGARELLQEVLSEGDAAQQQRAQALLDSLS